MKRCVLSLERKGGREDEFRVSGGSEFQRRGPMTEKALLPSDDRTYGMERTSESDENHRRRHRIDIFVRRFVDSYMVSPPMTQTCNQFPTTSHNYFIEPYNFKELTDLNCIT